MFVSQCEPGFSGKRKSTERTMEIKSPSRLYILRFNEGERKFVERVLWHSHGISRFDIIPDVLR